MQKLDIDKVTIRKFKYIMVVNSKDRQM